MSMIIRSPSAQPHGHPHHAASPCRLSLEKHEFDLEGPPEALRILHGFCKHGVGGCPLDDGAAVQVIVDYRCCVRSVTCQKVRKGDPGDTCEISGEPGWNDYCPDHIRFKDERLN